MGDQSQDWLQINIMNMFGILRVIFQLVHKITGSNTCGRLTELLRARPRKPSKLKDYDDY